MKSTIAQKIVEDARQDAQRTVAEAQAKADEIVESAQRTALEQKQALQAEVKVKCRDIADRKAALARLEGSKIALWAKYHVIEGVYERAMQKLVALPKEDAVKLVVNLLKFANKGDKVYFAKGFAYAEEVKATPSVQKKNLTFAEEGADIQGGVIIEGATADQNLSFEALLAEDKNQYAAQIAAKLF